MLRAVAFGSRLLPTRPVKDFHLQSSAHAGHTKWRAYDACALIEDGARFPELLVDQGGSDGFLDSGLRPWLLEDACKKADIPLTLRMQEGYDHSYFFISSFMDDHMRWHAARLA